MKIHFNLTRFGFIAFFVGVASIFINTGCESSFYNVVSRSVKEPDASIPTAVPFSSITGIPISWDADELADSFVVYRKLMPVGSKTVVYRGTDTAYTDSNVETLQIYQYTLAKVRGAKEYPSGLPAYSAIDFFHTEDPNGNNDSQARAYEFTTYQISDFIFYYADGAGNIIEDRDWYYCDLPAHTRKYIRLSYPTEGPIYLMVETDVPNKVSNGSQFSVKNGTNVSQRLYFCVETNLSEISITTKKNWAYDLDFVDLEVYNP